MTRYIYRSQRSDDSLEHFDLDDLKKAASSAGKAIGETVNNAGKAIGNAANNASKVVAKVSKSAGKIADDVVKSASKAAGDATRAASKTVSDVSKAAGKTAQDISKAANKAVDDAGKAIKNIGKKRTGDYKGGKKDREWKNHEYGERHRDENGKWRYDTDGNGSKSKKKDSEYAIRDEVIQEPVNLKEPSPLYKALQFLNPTKLLNIDGFVDEWGKQAMAKVRQFGKETDETGLPLKDENEQWDKEDDMKIANPGWNNDDAMSQNNCPCTSMAYEMRRRGYEVTARQTDAGLSAEEIQNFFEDPDVITVGFDPSRVIEVDGVKHNEGLAEAASIQMSTEEEGSRGVAYVQWLNQSGGHIFNYEIENGEPVIYDAQPGEKHSLRDYAANSSSWTYYRTDNLEPKYDEIRKVVK